LKKFPWEHVTHMHFRGIVAVTNGFVTDTISNPEHDDVRFMLEVRYLDGRQYHEVFIITDGDKYHLCSRTFVEACGDEAIYRSCVLWRIKRPPQQLKVKIQKDICDFRIEIIER